jgi:hypothetical protein
MPLESGLAFGQVAINMSSLCDEEQTGAYPIVTFFIAVGFSQRIVLT